MPPPNDPQTYRSSAHAPGIIIVVMGVAGTGKSTLGIALAQSLRFAFIEGDALHPKSNVDKMSIGIPLTDLDREPWLRLLRTTALRHLSEQHQALHEEKERREFVPMGAVVSCSALKSYYREILRGKRLPVCGGEDEADDDLPLETRTLFVYIDGTKALMEERIAMREGHFMKPAMLTSQLAALESPLGEEGVIRVSLAHTTEEQVRTAREELKALGFKVV